MNGNGMEKSRREEVAMVPKAGWGDKSAAWGDDDDVSYSEGQCGVGTCRPGVLQVFSGIKTFTAIFGLVVMFVTGLRAYIAYNNMWLQRQYDLHEDQAGMLVSCMDIGFLVMVLFLSAVAKRWHIPRTLSIATAVVGVGALLVFMPHAIHKSELTPPPKVTEDTRFTMDKLLFMAPTCTVNPEMQGAMMKLMSGSGGGDDCDEGGAGKSKASASSGTPDNEKTGDESNDPPTVVETGGDNAGPTYNEPTDPAESTTNGTQPEPGVTQAPTTLLPPGYEMKTVELPDFKLLSSHKMFDTLVQMAKAMYQVDLAEAAKMNRKDQLVFIQKNMPADSQDKLNDLKKLLGDDAPKYFYTTQVPVPIEQSRRRRDVSTNETSDASEVEPTSKADAKRMMFEKLQKDQMWKGDLAKMLKAYYPNLLTNPCTMKKIKKMAAEMCPFNTHPFFEEPDSAATLFVVLVSIGMVLAGLAKASYPAFLSMYVDNRTSDAQTGVFMGFIFMCAVLGPVLGFLLFALTSNTYTTLEDTGLMGYLNPRWLAAWWIGPLVVCVVCVVFSIPLFFFPNVKDRRSKSANVKGVAKITKGFFQGFVRLLCNPIFLLVTLGNAVTVMAAEGMLSHLALFVEKHFSFSIEIGFGISLLMGFILVIGTILGGVVTSCIKLSPFNCLKVVAGCTLVMVILQASSLGLGCDQPVLNKGDMMVNDTDGAKPCAQTCICMDFVYMPVCGSDGVSYFSPCHAGCGHPLDKEWHYCKCMGDDVQTAKPGLCPQDCQQGMFYGYSIVMGFTCLLLALKAVPAFIATLRCVERQDAHIAIGLNAFLATLIGVVPGPMIFSAIFENSCLMDRTKCGPVDTCAIYDVNALGMRFNGLGAGLRALAALFYVVAMVLGFRGGSVYSRAVHETERRK